MATYIITVVKTPDSYAGTVRVGSSFGSGIVQEEGTTVSIRATASSGYSFTSWELDSVLLSTNAIDTFVMPSNNVTLTANFTEVTPPLSTEQPNIFDTTCPRFLFIENLSDRFFTGDVVDFTSFNPSQVEEPINFDTGKFKLERDENYHGFNYEFSVDELQYEIGSEGYDYLKTKLYSSGTDTDVKFVYGFGSISSFTIFYIGKVDFNAYTEVDNGEKISFSLVELDFDNLLQTAFEIPQEISLTKDVRLYSKVIPKRIQYQIEIPEDVLGIGVGLAARAWFADAFRTPDPPNPDNEEVNKTSPIGYLLFNDGRSGDSDFDEFYTYDFALNDNAPIDSLQSIFVAKEAGLYDVTVKFWCGLFLTNIPNFTSFDFMTLKFVKVDTDGTTILSTTSVNSSNTITLTNLLDPSKVIEFEESLTFELNLDQSLYIYIELDPSDASFPSAGTITAIVPYPFDYDTTIPQIEIVGQTQAKQSTAKIESTFDVINTVCKEAVEVDYTILKSDFFENSCGSLLYLTNGFNIRGINDKNLKVAPKNIIDMVSKLYCLGFGVEYDEAKNELVVIEPVEYFYQDVEIMSFNSISDYKKEIDTSKYYNEVEVGFSKYSKQRETDKGFTLDDVHTKHTYQTPIKTNKNKLSIITDLTLSAYEIEILRRKQFEKDGNKVKSNFREDEDVYGLQLTSSTPSETFEYPNNKIAYEDTTLTIIEGTYDFVLEVGDVVTYVSRAGTSQTRTVVYFGVSSWDILGNLVFQTYIGFAESLVGTIGGVNDVSITKTSASSLLLPEGSQPFEVIENLLSPATTYNLRYTPKRMLYNWAKLLNGGFFGKNVTDNIIFKQGDGNVELVTQFVETEDCLLGDTNRDEIVEGANVQIQNFYDGNFLFLPIRISFSVSLSFEQLTDLKKCLRGQDGTKDYGYVTIINSCGEEEKIFITSIEYSGVTEEATIEGYLKEL
jgi:uncharacterized repeat protein (TIGR02543 family)